METKEVRKQRLQARKVDPDKFVGAYEKYKVKRTDGSHRRGKKHENCEYYVLDLHHDKFAKAAMRAYAKACKKEYPQLAADLQAVIKRMPYRFGQAQSLYSF